MPFLIPILKAKIDVFVTKKEIDVTKATYIFLS
jgi:hypothetical protein